MVYDKVLTRMFDECPRARHDDLSQLIERYPFWVADLDGFAAADGSALGGYYYYETKQIVIGANVSSPLRVYLHETVHAGAWTGWPMLQHNEAFSDAVDKAFAFYGIMQCESSRHYCTRDNRERWLGRQESGLTWVGLSMMLSALFFKYDGSVTNTGLGFLVAAGIATDLIKKIRQSRN